MYQRHGGVYRRVSNLQYHAALGHAGNLAEIFKVATASNTRIDSGEKEVGERTDILSTESGGDERSVEEEEERVVGQISTL